MMISSRLFNLYTLFSMNTIRYSLSTTLLMLLLLISGCDESDDIASALLYQDDGDTGGVSFTMRTVDQWDLGDGTILYGVDVEVFNTTESEPAENIRLDLVEVSPDSFLQNFSAERREMSFLSPSQSQLFDSYWCFYCDQSNEVRVGNYFVIISQSAGSGERYNLRFTGRYNLAGETTEVDFTRNITTVGSAPPSP